MTQNGAKRLKGAKSRRSATHGRSVQRKPCRFIRCRYEFSSQSRKLGRCARTCNETPSDRHRIKPLHPSTRCCRHDPEKKVSCPAFDLRTDPNCNQRWRPNRLSTICKHPKGNSARWARDALLRTSKTQNKTAPGVLLASVFKKRFSLVFIF